MSARADVPLPDRMSPALSALFARLLAELPRSDSSEWSQTEGTIEAAVYSDPQVLQREIAKVFRRMPLCLGHADQLRAAGSVLARDLFGLPLLLVRDREAQVQVLLNVCRHRGARLLAGEETLCQRQALTCPYHGWTYALDGSLRALPAAEAFPTLDRATHGLRRLPSTVRHGLIWALLEPGAIMPDVGTFLGDIDVDLDTLGLGGHRFFRQHARRHRCNWKLMMDAFQEVYHIKTLHGGTIAPFFLERKTAGEGTGLHTRILVGRDRLPEALALPPTQWDLRRHATLTHAIFPNSLIIYHPDATSHMGMFPITPDEMLFVHTFFTPHEARNDKERAHWERTFTMIDEGVFGAEDLWISEQIQLGLQAGANTRFVFGRFEQHLQRFHAHLARLLAATG